MIDKGKYRLGLMSAAAAVFALATSGCAAHAVPLDSQGPGFLLGFWHGLIAPISFVVSLIRPDVAIYAVPNDGHWYDFGFLVGFSGWLSGRAAASVRRKSSRSTNHTDGTG